MAPASRRCTARFDCWPTAAAARRSAHWPARAGCSPPVGRRGQPRNRPAELELGYAADDFGYLVDLGLPQMAGIDSMFDRDPEIKREVVFAGGVLRPGSTLWSVARARSPRRAPNPVRGYDVLTRSLPTYRSVLAEFADPGRLPELAAVRDRLRGLAVLRRLPGRRHRAVTPTPCRHPHTGARRRRCRPRRRHPDDRRSGFRRPAPRGRRRLRRRDAVGGRHTTGCSTCNCGNRACTGRCAPPNCPTAHCVSCCGRLPC